MNGWSVGCRGEIKRRDDEGRKGKEKINGMIYIKNRNKKLIIRR